VARGAGRSRISLLALAACFAAGVVAAGLTAVGGTAADTTTSTTSTEVTTAPVSTVETTTVVATATVEHTTTQRIILPATTTAAESSSSSTPGWVWVLVGVLAVGLIVAGVLLLAHRGGSMSATDRRHRLDGAVHSWLSQGWAVESQTSDSAVLVRDGERMILTVDASGGITTRGA
jgi:hypothetical protein